MSRNSGLVRGGNRQSGFVLVMGMALLVVITLIAVNTLGESMVQDRLATSLDSQTRAFSAAEVALEGTLFEASDENMITAQSDALSSARAAGTEWNPDEFGCFEDKDGKGIPWASRTFDQSGLRNCSADGAGCSSSLATFDDQADSDTQVRSWARTAFSGERPCSGSSVVLNGIMTTCHQFVIRGCGRVTGQVTAAANSLNVEIYAPASVQ